MKGIFGRQRGPAPPVLALVALLLTLGVVSTTPFAWAKYAAGATVSASGTVAKFNPVWTHTEGCNDGGGYVIHPGNWTKTRNIKWNVKNSGETMINCKVTPKTTKDGDNATAHSDYSVGTYAQTSRVDLTPAMIPYTLTAASNVAIGSNTTFTFGFDLDATAPTAPNQTNKTGSYESDVSTLWVTYRVNFDGLAVQVD